MTRAFDVKFRGLRVWMNLRLSSFTVFQIFFRIWLPPVEVPADFHREQDEFYLKNPCRAGIQPSDTTTYLLCHQWRQK